MDRGKIRVALAALSVAGLLAGLTVSGCRSASSCTGTSKSGAMQQDKSASSCTGTHKGSETMAK